jgi:hypothetical protein
MRSRGSNVQVSRVEHAVLSVVPSFSTLRFPSRNCTAIPVYNVTSNTESMSIVMGVFTHLAPQR